MSLYSDEDIISNNSSLSILPGKFPDVALIHFVESPGSVLSLVLIPFGPISIPLGYFYIYEHLHYLLHIDSTAI